MEIIWRNDRTYMDTFVEMTTLGVFDIFVEEKTVYHDKDYTVKTEHFRLGSMLENSNDLTYSKKLFDTKDEAKGYALEYAEELHNQLIKDFDSVVESGKNASKYTANQVKSILSQLRRAKIAIGKYQSTLTQTNNKTRNAAEDKRFIDSLTQFYLGKPDVFLSDGTRASFPNLDALSESVKVSIEDIAKIREAFEKDIRHNLELERQKSSSLLIKLAKGQITSEEFDSTVRNPKRGKSVTFVS